MGSGLLLRAVQDLLIIAIRLLKLQIIRLPLYTLFIGVYTMGNVQFIWFDCGL
jgi:hypothetical protein